MAGALAWRMARQAPSWYLAARSAAADDWAAADDAERQLSRVQNLSARAVAQRKAARRRDASQPPPAPVEIEFAITQAQVNALLAKWSVVRDVRRVLDPIGSEPMVRLAEGRLTLALRLRSTGGVVALELAPEIDPSGRLTVRWTDASAGRLPVPAGLVQAMAQRAAGRVTGAGASGVTDEGAVGAAFAGALLRDLLDAALHARAIDPILPLPHADGTFQLARLTALRLEEGAASAVLRVLDDGDRDAARERLPGR